MGLYNFTLIHNFRLIITYHTQGEVIFWRYLDFEPVGAEDIARQLAQISGYELVNETETNSYAGYRDWFIIEFNRSGFTIET